MTCMHISLLDKADEKYKWNKLVLLFTTISFRENLTKN